MNTSVIGADSAPLRFFEEISAIPRASRNEAEIADYLERFAAERGLFCRRDASCNVLIKKGASVGREAEPALMLQAHTDMVTEKNEGVAHDFATQGLRLLREGNILRADGTTLGADDGFGVAIMLAALDDDTLSHPALECLFTAAEEVGLVGASACDYSDITAKRMINLDSAEEDRIIVGCCGGHRTDLLLDVQTHPADGEGILVKVSGLCGGHSGEDIHRGRGHALAILQGLLCELRKTQELRFAHLVCPGRSNVIPRECSATVCARDRQAAETLLRAAADRVLREPRLAEDAGLCIEIEKAPYRELWSVEDTDRMLQLLGLPHGVLAWRVPGLLPQTSRNLGLVCYKRGMVGVSVSTRSPNKKTLLASDAELERIVTELGGEVDHQNAYPGWESDENSAFVKGWQQAYRTAVGGELTVSVIHAGLECGVICDAIEGMEAIAIGCNIHDLHSPKERMELDSFERIWQTVRCFLAQQ